MIRASSKTVDVRDGRHDRKGYWAIMAEKKPDHYYTEIPEQPHRVTFVTDKDSISFDVTYGRDYDFIILLNGKDSCYTRISARYRNYRPLARTGSGAGTDTIPFRIGDNSKIYIQGSVNGSRPLDIQLDLGAGGSVVKRSSVPKIKFSFDQKITLHNTDGSHEVPSASRNLLQIGNLAWDSVGIAVADNMTHREDLIVGNSLFRGKVLEINYDKRMLVVHDTFPSQATGYSCNDLLLDDGVIPFIEVSLTGNAQPKKGWAMFDTGAYTTILNKFDVPVAYRIWGELMRLIGPGSTGFSPRLRVGDRNFSGFNYNVQDMGEDGLHLILGNDLLKRFNVILDNRSGHVHLKANSLAELPYGKRGEYYLVLIAIVLIIMLFATVMLYEKIRKRKRI